MALWDGVKSNQNKGLNPVQFVNKFYSAYISVCSPSVVNIERLIA